MDVESGPSLFFPEFSRGPRNYGKQEGPVDLSCHKPHRAGRGSEGRGPDTTEVPQVISALPILLTIRLYLYEAEAPLSSNIQNFLMTRHTKQDAGNPVDPSRWWAASSA